MSLIFYKELPKKAFASFVEETRTTTQLTTLNSCPDTKLEMSLIGRIEARGKNKHTGKIFILHIINREIHNFNYLRSVKIRQQMPM